MSSEYLIGRVPAKLVAPFAGADKLFASERIDGQRLTDGQFEHCSFANISFKEAELQGCRFLDCVFISCYFRRATLKGSSFVGCKFIDCNFPHTKVQSCDFRYAQFKRCFVPLMELRFSLPSELNLKEDLTSNLARQAELLGQYHEARLYRLEAISARHSHLKAAVMGESSWYKDHYPGGRRIQAAFQLIYGKLNGFVWGHGEKVSVLLVHYFVSLAGLFALFYYWRRSGFIKASGIVSFMDVLMFSFQTILPGTNLSEISPVYVSTKLAVGVENVLALLLAGLLGSYIFRWIMNK